ncbi:MAG: lytic transglycosylase domain-containing protein [Deltaproteobacteria bacterium]|nr:lytic transglycosylase domain-containing protein [Deltaproteobacteria bacterium]
MAFAFLAELPGAAGAASAPDLLLEYNARQRAERLDVAGTPKEALPEWLRIIKLCRRETFFSCAEARKRVLALVRDETACDALGEVRRLIQKGDEPLLQRPSILCAIRKGRVSHAMKPLRDLVVRASESPDGVWARDVALPEYIKAGGSWPHYSAREKLDEAVALRRAKRFDEALQKFRALDFEWRGNPSAADLRRLLPFETALTQFRATSLEAAEAGFRKLVKEARSVEQADGYRFWLASTFQKQGRLLDASKLFEQIYGRHAREDSARSTLMRSIEALRKTSEVERISRLFERLGADFPNHAPSVELAFRAVRVLADAGLFKLARAAATRFMRRFGKHRRRADADWMIAWSTFKLAEWKRAAALFNSLARRSRVGSGTVTEGAAYWAAVASEKAAVGGSRTIQNQFARLAETTGAGFYRHLAQSRSAPIPRTPKPISPLTTSMGDATAIEQAFKRFLQAHPLANRSALRALTFVQKGLLDEADRELFRIQEQIRTAKGGPKVSVVPPPTSNDRAWMRRTARGILLDLNGLHRVLGNTYRVAQNLRFSYGYRINGDDAWLRSAFPTPFSEIVARAAHEHRVPLDLIYAIMHTESSFTPDAVSPANAQGLMQILPSTAKKIAAQRGMPFDARDLTAISKNIDFGVWYLRELLTKFHDQLPLAIAAYNGGPHNVAAWLDNKAAPARTMDEFLEDIPFRETRFYVRKVIAAVGVYRKLYGAGGRVTVPIALDTRYENNINF